MKKVYLLRHGESDVNINNVWETRESDLTERGQLQSKLKSKELERLSINVIISSSMKRAISSAKIISEVIKQNVEISALFDERRQPSEMLNKEKDNPKIIEIYNTIKESFYSASFRYSDEENFNDLKERVKRILKYLSNRPEDTILVVTHGFLIRFICAYIIFGDSSDGKKYMNVLDGLKVDHCSIVNIIKINPDWQLVIDKN